MGSGYGLDAKPGVFCRSFRGRRYNRTEHIDWGDNRSCTTNSVFCCICVKNVMSISCKRVPTGPWVLRIQTNPTNDRCVCQLTSILDCGTYCVVVVRAHTISDIVGLHHRPSFD